MNIDLRLLFEKARQRLSFTATIELIEAVYGVKVSRLAFSENNIPWIDDLISEVGGHWEPAYAPFYHKPDKGKGTWSSLAEQSDRPRHQSGRSWQLYLSNDADQARWARDMEASNDEEALGAVLGIPACCVDFYIKTRSRASQTQNDFTLHSANQTSDTLHLPHWNNTLTQYFGSSLLSFAPCSYHCMAAQQYAKNRFVFAHNIMPQEAADILALQICACIYTEFEGVHLFKVTSRSRQGLCIDPDSLMSTRPNGSWASYLRTTQEIQFDAHTGRITLIGKNSLRQINLQATMAFFDFCDVSHKIDGALKSFTDRTERSEKILP